MQVRDIMTTNVVCIDPNTSLREAAQKMKDNDTGALPVLSGPEGEPIGILTDRDIAIRAVAEGATPDDTVDRFVTRQVVTIEPDADIDDASRIMGDRQIRRLCVVENGHLVGIISLGDLAVIESNEAEDALEDISHGARAEGDGGSRPSA